jgi:hypothetical protein
MISFRDDFFIQVLLFGMRRRSHEHWTLFEWRLPKHTIARRICREGRFYCRENALHREPGKTNFPCLLSIHLTTGAEDSR